MTRPPLLLLPLPLLLLLLLLGAAGTLHKDPMQCSPKTLRTQAARAAVGLDAHGKGGCIADRSSGHPAPTLPTPPPQGPHSGVADDNAPN